MQNFTELDCWKACREFSDWSFEMTKQFPSDERFGLRQSLNEAARSATRNIAKSQGRTLADSIRLLRLSRSAINEAQDDLITAKSSHYIPEKVFEEGSEKLTASSKLVSGYIRYLRTKLEEVKEGEEEEATAQ